MSWRAWQGGDLFCLVLSGLISIRCSCWHHLTSFWRCLKLWNSKFTMIMIPVKVAVRNVYSTHCLSHTGIILVLYIPLLLLIIFRLPAMLESVVWFPEKFPRPRVAVCFFLQDLKTQQNFSASGNVAGRAVENIQVCLSLCWYLPVLRSLSQVHFEFTCWFLAGEQCYTLKSCIVCCLTFALFCIIFEPIPAWRTLPQGPCLFGMSRCPMTPHISEAKDDEHRTKLEDLFGSFEGQVMHVPTCSKMSCFEKIHSGVRISKGALSGSRCDVCA